jgi:hypothetical protein
MDVNTDSGDVLYKSKLNIDGLKTCEGRSSLDGPATNNKISNYLDCLFVCRVLRHNIPIRMN